MSLDQSTAFETTDYDSLISMPENSFGISGSVLSWISSYLYDRTLSVCLLNDCSSPVSLTFRVRQGSVLEPILFQTLLKNKLELITTVTAIPCFIMPRPLS